LLLLSGEEEEIKMLRRGMNAQVWISKPEVRRQLAQAQVPARYLVLCGAGLSWEEGTGRRYHFESVGLETVAGGVQW
jgi:hypothetical protein